jgi:hypothetical protein
MEQLEFEKLCMDMILKGDNAVLEGLRAQYLNSVFYEREFTGAGFYTRYKINVEIPAVASGKTFQITDVFGNVGDIKNAIGLILFIKDGYLSMLEGYTIDSVWPQDYSKVTLLYNGQNGKRDFNKLERKWA